MNTIWKYVSLSLGIALVGVIIASFIFTNKWKDKLIECQEQSQPQIEYVEVHDTVTFEKPVIHWKTRYKNDTLINLDTLYLNDTVIIQQIVESVPDSFSTTSRYIDSNLDAQINIIGRGIYEKTFIDSVTLDYRYIKEEITPAKKCCWLKRIFCGCN